MIHQGADRLDHLAVVAFAGAAIDPRTDPNVYSAYHGYWPSPENIDFSDPDNPSPVPAVESRIGTDNDLRTFVSEAHGRDMKVLFDYVMNHVDVNSGLYQAHPELPFDLQVG